MSILTGTPSDELPGVLETGRTDVETLFVSMSKRHPEGRDPDYLQWHSLDHRPEQHRLPTVRASIRVVSTPACRAARVASDERYDDVDHIMHYLFTDRDLAGFVPLSDALAGAGRTPYLLPMVERSVYGLTGTAAAPRIKSGVDVLPWFPTQGAFVLIERGSAQAGALVETPGVAGAWWATGLADHELATSDLGGLQFTWCFLDGDPVETAEQLADPLRKRWADHGLEPLLAAPFQTVVPYAWDRYLP